MAEVMERDEKFAAVVRDFYGEYLATFYSENRQVRADLFRRGNSIYGYVKFLLPDPDDTTDNYLTSLRQQSKSLGLNAEHLQLIYTE